jgi:hypothetical protein
LIDYLKNDDIKDGTTKLFIELYYPLYSISEDVLLTSTLRCGYDFYFKEKLELPLSLRLNLGVLF